MIRGDRHMPRGNKENELFVAINENVTVYPDGGGVVTIPLLDFVIILF